MKFKQNVANMNNEKFTLHLIRRPKGKRMPSEQLDSAGDIILKWILDKCSGGLSIGSRKSE